jgi:NADPH-dependent 2,4-dienoyl-CoA reductase/sulfur reductase-like enzyme
MTRIVVIGAGPAGIAAACRAAESGAMVTLLDGNPYSGGQIWRRSIDYPVPRKAKRWFNRLDKAGVSLRSTETVIDITGSSVQAQKEQGRMERIAFDKLILTTGARELFLPFPGWTLPNVMGVGGAQTLLKAGMPVKGLRVVVGGSGPLLLAVAASLAKAGAKIVCVAEQTSRVQLAKFALGTLRYNPAKLVQGMGYMLQYFFAPYWLNTWIKEARGDSEVREVILTNGKCEWIELCDIVACAYGLVPSVELAALAGCKQENGRLVVDNLQRTSIEGFFAAGEMTGVGGIELAITEGEIAGLTAAGKEKSATKLIARRERQQKFARLLNQSFALRPQLKQLPADDTIVCRCEDVTFGELKNQTDQRSAKLYTRCGMGPCQGRVCSDALQYLLDWKPNKVRPPVLATKIGAFISK